MITDFKKKLEQAEERFSELEAKTIEIIQCTNRKKKRMKKSEQNIRIYGTPSMHYECFKKRREKERGRKNI